VPWLLAAVAFVVGAQLIIGGFGGGRLAMRVVGLLLWGLGSLLVLITVSR
jgi:hypothetical protein